MSGTAALLAAMSTWIDDAQPASRSAEAVTWGRIAKIAEENGEAVAAYIGHTGQNPRKGVTHDEMDVIQELLDVAVTALGAVEHMTGNGGHSMTFFDAKVRRITDRAGITTGGTLA